MARSGWKESGIVTFRWLAKLLPLAAAAVLVAQEPTIRVNVNLVHVITTVKNTVKQAAIGVPNVTVTVTYPDTYAGTSPAVHCADRNCRVIVDASAPFVPLPSQYLLGGAFQITLKGGSQLVIQR